MYLDSPLVYLSEVLVAVNEDPPCQVVNVEALSEAAETGHPFHVFCSMQ